MSAGSSRPAVGRLRAYWDERARENAMWFVDTSLTFDDPEEDRFWATGREIVRDAVVDAPVRSAARGRAVEIGSGLGRLCVALADHYDEVIGVDIAPEMVARATELVDRDGVSFRVGDGASLTGIESSSVDLVLSFTVFQHFPDPAIIGDYLAEIGRVLAPGGVVAFQWNNEPGPRRWAVRRMVLAKLQQLGIRRERRGRHAAEFLGCRVPLDRIRRMLDDAGLRLDSTAGEGTLFAWAWATRP